MKRSWYRKVYGAGFAVALALLPASVHAWNWGALWTVYDGQWPREQNCGISSFGNVGYWGQGGPLGGAGCGPSYPVALLAASSGGHVQAATQIAPNEQMGWDPAWGEVWRFYYAYAQGLRGSAVSVNPGTAVTIEWACMNKLNNIAGGECSMLGCNMGHSDTGVTSYTFFTASGGNNFPTNGAFVGSTTVYPQQTTTYTLRCVGGPANVYANGYVLASYETNVPDAYLTVTVNIASCGPAIGAAPGNSSGWVLPARATRQFNAGGYRKCLTNNGSYDLFIPGHSQGEIDAFMTHHPGSVSVQ
jgi:hypothetical protein